MQNEIITKEPTNICPHCEYEDNTDASMEIESMSGDIIFTTVCKNCGRTYKDVYNYKHTEILEENVKNYFKVRLNGYDELYSTDEFKDKQSLLAYFQENEIKDENASVLEADIKELEHTEIKETDAYTENDAMMYLDCSNCSTAFQFKNYYDENYQNIREEYELNQQAMFVCPYCNQHHIITEIEEDPFRGRG